MLGDVDALAARLTAIRRACRRSRPGGEGQARRVPRRAGRAQGDAGRRGRRSRNECDAVEGRGRPAARNSRGVADHQRAGPQDRRCAVEAVLDGPRDVQSPPRLAFRRPRPRTRRRAGRPRRRCANAPRNWPSSTDWGATGAAFRDLLTEWKAVGRAAKDVDDTLWQRFKAAQDTFFAARNAATAERDAEFRANADAKEALLRRGRKGRHRRRGRGAGGAAHDRREVGRDRQGAARAEGRARATAARRGEEGARRAIRRCRSRGAGPGRPIPCSRGAIRAAGGEGCGGRAGPRTPRRPGPTPNSGVSGPTLRPRRLAGGVRASSALSRRRRCRRSCLGSCPASPCSGVRR